ncbi:uncharacterized protein LOC132168119 [Corylus avellana]|uniref:uncharacterized protein LOC132168119 n=1 Tax=Corylus avellana TaxID=13451 RepID=UPI00286ABFB7|nr:uncharacterized protein LOC132168119 [Corylus avellana]
MRFSRNTAVHNGVILDAKSLSCFVKKVSLDHFEAWKRSFPAELWSPPEPNTFKINFDTTIRESFSTQSAICRDSNGRIIKAISQISPLCDPTYGEALAASFAISMATSLKLLVFSLEGDSQVVITALLHLP